MAGSEVVLRGVTELWDLQLQLDWPYVAVKFRYLIKGWVKALEAIKQTGGKSARELWVQLLAFMKVIRPKALHPRWTSSIDGHLPAREMWLRTDPADAEAVLRAVRVLRAHILYLSAPVGFDFAGNRIAVSESAKSAGDIEAPIIAPLSALDTPEVAPVSAPQSLCGINGCPLPTGHAGLCALDVNEAARANRRRSSAEKPQSDQVAPSQDRKRKADQPDRGGPRSEPLGSRSAARSSDSTSRQSGSAPTAKPAGDRTTAAAAHAGSNFSRTAASESDDEHQPLSSRRVRRWQQGCGSAMSDPNDDQPLSSRVAAACQTNRGNGKPCADRATPPARSSPAKAAAECPRVAAAEEATTTAASAPVPSRKQKPRGGAVPAAVDPDAEHVPSARCLGTSGTVEARPASVAAAAAGVSQGRGAAKARVHGAGVPDGGSKSVAIQSPTRSSPARASRAGELSSTSRDAAAAAPAAPARRAPASVAAAAGGVAAGNSSAAAIAPGAEATEGSAGSGSMPSPTRSSPARTGRAGGLSSTSRSVAAAAPAVAGVAPAQRCGECVGCLRTEDCGACPACSAARRANASDTNRATCCERVCRNNTALVANVLFRQEKYADALPYYAAAISERRGAGLDEKLALSFSNRSLCYFRMGGEHLANALMDAESALALQPKNPTFYLRKANAISGLHGKRGAEYRAILEEAFRVCTLTETDKSCQKLALLWQQLQSAPSPGSAPASACAPPPPRAESTGVAVNHSLQPRAESEPAASASRLAPAAGFVQQPTPASSIAAAEPSTRPLVGIDASATVETRGTADPAVRGIPGCLAPQDAALDSTSNGAAEAGVLEHPEEGAPPRQKALRAAVAGASPLPVASTITSSAPLCDTTPLASEPMLPAGTSALSLRSASDDAAGVRTSAANGVAGPVDRGSTQQSPLRVAGTPPRVGTPESTGWDSDDSVPINRRIKDLLSPLPGHRRRPLPASESSVRAPAPTAVDTPQATSAPSEALPCSSAVAASLDDARTPASVAINAAPSTAELAGKPEPPLSHLSTEQWTEAQAAASVGWRVSVYWGGDTDWFNGVILRARKDGRVLVLYDDKDRRVHQLWLEDFEWLEPPSAPAPAVAAAARSIAASAPSVAASVPSAAASAPSAAASAPSAAASAPSAAASAPSVAASAPSVAAAATRVAASATSVAASAPSVAPTTPSTPASKASTLNGDRSALSRPGVVTSAADSHVETAQPASVPQTASAIAPAPSCSAAPSSAAAGAVSKPTSLGIAEALNRATTALLVIEDDIPMDQVTRAFGSKVRQFRKAVRASTTLTDVAKEMRALRLHMLDTDGANLFVHEDWHKDELKCKEWFKAAKQPAISFSALATLMLQLQQSRVGETADLPTLQLDGSDLPSSQPDAPDPDCTMTRASERPAAPSSLAVERISRVPARPAGTELALQQVLPSGPPVPATCRRPWTKAEAEAAVGRNIRIMSGADQRWCHGKIIKTNEQTRATLIEYSVDLKVKWHKLWELEFEWLQQQASARDEAAPPKRARKAQQQDATRHRPASAPKAREQAAESPEPVLQPQQSSSRPPPVPLEASVPFGSETTAPRFLIAKPDQCSCDAITAPCSDPCCANYRYYDMFKAPLATDGRRKVVRFGLNDGMVIKGGGSSHESTLELIATLGGVRQHRDTRIVECLCQWFVQATDNIITWKSEFGWDSPPHSLVFRVGGVDPSQWTQEWEQAGTVLRKCQVRQVTPRRALQRCCRLAKASQFFFDSVITDPSNCVPERIEPEAAEETSSDDEDEVLGERLRRRHQSASQPPAPSVLPPTEGKRYRIKKRPLDEAIPDLGAGESSAREVHGYLMEEPAREEHPQQRLCGRCGDGTGDMLLCSGSCMRAFHFQCAGVVNTSQRRAIYKLLEEESDGWSCSDCRQGTQDCFSCKRQGHVGIDLVRCNFTVMGKPACGKVFHRKCIDADDADDLAGFVCRLHSCCMCNKPEGKKPLVRCWCCTNSFCNRPACLPAGDQVELLGNDLSSGYLICDKSKPHHGFRSQVLDRSQLYRSTPVDDLRAGADFSHVALPEKGDRVPGSCHNIGALSGTAPELDQSLDFAFSLRDLQRLPSQKGRADASSIEKIQAGDFSDLETVPAHLRWERSFPFGLTSVLVRNHAEVAPSRSNGHGQHVEVSRMSEEPRFAFLGRRYPLQLSRRGTDRPRGQDYLPHLPPMQLCVKLATNVLPRASGPGSSVSEIVRTGTALDPSLNIWHNSTTSPDCRSNCSSADSEILSIITSNHAFVEVGDLPVKQLQGMRHALQRALNGLSRSRLKYTTFSRHYTSHAVLVKIASLLRPHLQAGDTFVDFACGQNTFAPLLSLPGSSSPLPSVSFDIIPPGDMLQGFNRRSWNQVDAVEDLPPGELVIGINPPFGWQNKTAIEFVEHARCAQPRLIVLIFPATNYHPAGYELIERNTSICPGHAFYTPGSSSSSWISAKNATPSYMLFKRLSPVPGPRSTFCQHKCHHLKLRQEHKRRREQREAYARHSMEDVANRVTMQHCTNHSKKAQPMDRCLFL